MSDTDVVSVQEFGPTKIGFAKRAKITAGLAMFGAAAGAVAGGIVVVLVAAASAVSISSVLDPILFLLGASFGAPLGALLLPIAGWTLMRHVPFGRAFVGTVLGTVLGGLVGWFSGPSSYELGRALLGGFAGFALAVILLRRAATAKGLTAAEYTNSVDRA